MAYQPVERPDLTLMDRLVFPAIVKGMIVTASHVFRKKTTMQYPEEKWTLPEYYRGVPVLVMDDEGIVLTKALGLDYVLGAVHAGDFTLSF